MPQFLPNPGPRERQLKRKYENPLFDEAEDIQQLDVDKARQQDQQELEAFLIAFRQQVEQAASLDGKAEADDILKIKAQLEQIYPRACGQAGDSSLFMTALDKLISVISQALVNAAGTDEEALSRIRDDREHSDLHLKISKFPLVADLLSEQEIIPQNELAATLLGEDEASLAAAVLIFSPEQLSGIINQGEELISSHPAAAERQPGILARLQQMKDWMQTQAQ